MLKRNKKAAAAIFMVASVALLSGSFAWLTKNADVTNIFATGNKTYDTVILEKVNDDTEFKKYYESSVSEPNIVPVNENFKPGDTNIKEVKFSNEGDFDTFIRIKVTPILKQNGSDIHNSLDKVEGGDENPIIIPNWNIASFKFEEDGVDWQYNSQDGYYYYRHILRARNDANTDDETPLILNSVTFNSKAGIEHQNLQYDLKIELETVQTSQNNESISVFSEVEKITVTENDVEWYFKQ